MNYSRILLVTGNYLPGKNGGIENYTYWLATILTLHGFQVEIAALNPGETGDYEHEGIKVNNLRGSFYHFEHLIKNKPFDICHFHEYSGKNGINVAWLKAARLRCLKVFFTFHLPYLTCYKADFRYLGTEDCHTFSNPARCTQCVIADKLPPVLNGNRPGIQWAVSAAKLSGWYGKLEKRILARYHELDELIASCDNIFIYAAWFRDILLENGYNAPSVKKIPYKTRTFITSPEIPKPGIRNKLLFVGRIQHDKGLHLLCAAMNQVADKELRMDVYGNIVDDAYYRSCLDTYKFNFKGTKPYEQLLGVLQEYDFLVLPSVFSEMYSLIIKDAFYEQLPVIASAAKGNVDAVSNGVSGFLFEYGNARDLALTIEKAYAWKKKGWKPVFSYPANPREDVEEIVSYYQLTESNE